MDVFFCGLGRWRRWTTRRRRKRRRRSRRGSKAGPWGLTGGAGLGPEHGDHSGRVAALGPGVRVVEGVQGVPGGRDLGARVHVGVGGRGRGAAQRRGRREEEGERARQ
jgi:hypothetical protein